MNTYIGTKIINATPMNRADYNFYRGWSLPADENGADEGYLVEYLDGGKPNHPDHAGYISWSPKEQFDNAYESMGDVSALPAHQQRVVAEFVQLKNRLEKLLAFLTGALVKTLEPAEQGRLQRQAQLMSSYLEVLNDRIQAFQPAN